MIKSKRKARNFINYLYKNYDVPRIPIDVHSTVLDAINGRSWKFPEPPKEEEK